MPIFSEIFSSRGAAPPACHRWQDRPGDGAGEPGRREPPRFAATNAGIAAWHPTTLGGQDERLDRGAECCQRAARGALLCQNVRHDVSVIHLKLKPLGELFDCFQRVRKNLVAGVGFEQIMSLTMPKPAGRLTIRLRTGTYVIVRAEKAQGVKYRPTMSEFSP